MKTYKAIIIDDEEPGRKNLSIMLQKYCPEIEVIADAGSAVDAKQKIIALNPNVLFLDVQMPELDGFDLLDSLSQKNFCTVIVTAHAEYGIKAVKAGAVDYILKPIVIKELQQAVKKVIETWENKTPENISAQIPEHITLTHTSGFAVLKLQDIIRMEADDNYTRVYTHDKKTYYVSKPLKQFEDNLPENIFFRLHRSYIINLKHIAEYTKEDGGTVIMQDGAKIQIPRARYTDFMDALKKLSVQL
ncbi:MAG: response regulator transcription factor [Fimbriimonadaceae bacterium]|nr:response regulator transcription factor [Chitinophagales bacterium]